MMSSSRAYIVTRLTAAVPHLTTRHFARNFQTIRVNAAPPSTYQTTRRHYLIYLRPSAHPKPRVSVLLRHFLSTNIPIPSTHCPSLHTGKPWSHCLSPHFYHPTYCYITILFKTIRHLYLPTSTRAPSYIQSLPRKRTLPYPNLGQTLQP